MFAQNNKLHNQIKVLLVDNQKLSRKCIRSVLENAKGISLLLEASSGREAIEMSKSLKPNVVLIKDDLEDMKGSEACSLIQSALDNCNIIVLTTEDNEEKLLEALAAGAHGFFNLSMDLQKLFTAIQIVSKGDLWVDASNVNAVHRCARKALANGSSYEFQQRESLKESLTSREIEVLSLVAEGRSNNDISQELEISLHTTKSHISNILTKLKVNNRASAASLFKP